MGSDVSRAFTAVCRELDTFERLEVVEWRTKLIMLPSRPKRRRSGNMAHAVKDMG